MNVRVAIVGLCALLAVSCGKSSSSPSAPTPSAMNISIVSGARTLTTTAYSPNPVTITRGTTVTWVNNDGDLHTVTSSQGLFASPGLDPGDTFAYRFTAPGTYPYFCAVHPHMKGTILVQ